MGHGIVGGSLKDQTAQISAIAAVALRVIKGEPADDIPISSPGLNVIQADKRQLQRWGIRASRVPAGTLVKFDEPGVWDTYKDYILAAALVVLAQSALIFGLVIQRARRRAAEEQMRRSQLELRTTYERVRDLGVRLLHAQESERSRIARELHDDVSQQIALLEIDLELLGRTVHGADEMAVREAMKRTNEVAASIHDICHRLHPAKLRLIGLVATLQGLQRELSQSGLDVRFTYDNVPSMLDADLTLCIFRVVQEALQNAIKHSGARHVYVRLNGSPDRLFLTVCDDGVGFDITAAWGSGLGLISMSERLEAVGGTFNVRSEVGSGTMLTVTVPLSEVAKGETAAG
jgi:signal transduction histidine kinase